MSRFRLIAVLVAESSVGGVILWSLVLIGIAVAGFAVVAKLRSWLKSDDIAPEPVGFSLSDLKRLHREGKISAEELGRAREKMVGAAKSMASNLPDPLAGSRLARERQQQPPMDPDRRG